MKIFLRLGAFSFGCLAFYMMSNFAKEDVNLVAHNASVKAPLSVPSFPQEQIKIIHPVKPPFQVLPATIPEQKKSILSITDVREGSGGFVGLQDNEELSIANSNELKINAINELMRDAPDKKLSDISLINFNKEEFDYGWGMEYEKKINTFFHETPVFSDFSPDVIECRSKNCKILISAANKDQLTNISKSVIDAVYNNNNELIKNAIYVIDEQTNTLSFYFGRNEEDGSISTILK